MVAHVCDGCLCRFVLADMPAGKTFELGAKRRALPSRLLFPTFFVADWFKRFFFLPRKAKYSNRPCGKVLQTSQTLNHNEGLTPHPSNCKLSFTIVCFFFSRITLSQVKSFEVKCFHSRHTDGHADRQIRTHTAKHAQTYPADFLKQCFFFYFLFVFLKTNRI